MIASFEKISVIRVHQGGSSNIKMGTKFLSNNVDCSTLEIRLNLLGVAA